MNDEPHVMIDVAVQPALVQTREALIHVTVAESGYVVAIDDATEVPVPADARPCGEVRLLLPSGARVVIRTEWPHG